MCIIRQATMKDVEILAVLAIQMWKSHSIQDLAEEFTEIMEQGEVVFFIAEENGQAVGFAQCQLRHDYVEGTESSPVGYLEGIFVKEECRHKGYASRLLKECENWAKAQGCSEFASDCELDNHISLAFHLNVGFSEVNRIICFMKKL